MTDICTHDLDEMNKAIPSSAWGVIIMETEDGPEYHAMPDPDTDDPWYNDEVERHNEASGAIDHDDITALILNVGLFIDYAADPAPIQAIMESYGRVLVLDMTGDDGVGDGFTLFRTGEEPVLEVARRTLKERVYGTPCKHVLTAEGIAQSDLEAGERFMEEVSNMDVIGSVFEMLMGDEFHTAMAIEQMLDYPDDPEICTTIEATVVEAPVNLEIIDVALEVTPGGIASEEQKAEFERQLTAILGDAPEGGKAQKVKWPRYQLKAKAEEIRSAMDINLVYIAAYNEEDDLIMGLARKGKEPVLLLSETNY